ncbi:DinB family protein [Spirosoma rigui]|uniref:DinB family protein n=1 Tax=Spirosoma rigui TaxID=564064 RepID=UPI0009AF351E|nr:DinB family protein [Spirosoma rigui]
MQKFTTAHQLQARLAAVLDTVSREFKPQSDAQLRWKPSPDRWSVLECVQHLNLAERFYIRNIQHKVDALGLVQTPPVDQTLESDWVGKALLYIVDPKTTLKFPAPGIIRPRRPEELNPAEVLNQFIELQTILHDLLDKAVYLDWNNDKVSTLFGNWLKIRLGDALLMLVAHTERHMNQAMRVRNEMSSLTQAHS